MNQQNPFLKNFIGLIKTMRLRQWTKNVFIYTGLVFDGKLLDPRFFLDTTFVVLCFCLVSSSVYLMNDLIDIEKDKQHPRKRLRPLPSGQLNPRLAIIASIVLALVSIAAAFWMNQTVGLIVGAYFIQNVAYCFYLKNVVLIDAMIVALGFLLRVWAGVEIVQVENFSPWLYVCATLLALMLVFGKRRHEIALLEGGAAHHRASLEQYNLPLLDHIINMVMTSIFLAYTLYSFEAKTALAGEGQMLLTVPFVFYGILRYLYLIHVHEEGGEPEELLLRDRHILVTSVLWVLSVVLLIYVW